MNCPQCGVFLYKTSNFCPDCGFRFKPAQPPVQNDESNEVYQTSTNNKNSVQQNYYKSKAHSNPYMPPGAKREEAPRKRESEPPKNPPKPAREELKPPEADGNFSYELPVDIDYFSSYNPPRKIYEHTPASVSGSRSTLTEIETNSQPYSRKPASWEVEKTRKNEASQNLPPQSGSFSPVPPPAQVSVSPPPQAAPEVKPDSVFATNPYPPNYERRIKPIPPKQPDSEYDAGEYDDYYDEDDEDAKPFYRRWWFFVILALIIFGGTFYVLYTGHFLDKFLGGGSDSSGGTGGTSSTVSVSAESKDDQSGSDVSENPSVDPSDSKIAKTILPQLMQFEDNGFLVKNTRNIPSAGDSNFRPGEGMFYYIATVEVTNTSSENIMVNIFNFSLVTDIEPEEYSEPVLDQIQDPSIGVGGNMLPPSINLAPEETVIGDIIFKAPRNAGTLYLRFSTTGPPLPGVVPEWAFEIPIKK
ncbi:MAG: DUF4352 domain-containing protein [Oscillospiraceae bacterium]|jgi:uncharacterized Zn finger protein (UPF0148 family)|nr:DUF4352 domain-containing protein [Oscillospiraceae bacterium]